MGRPASFDRDTVLDQAMAVFWQNGYEATSIQDLVDATGLNRGSLYNAFKDKHGLFQAVMDRYAQTSDVRAILENPESMPPRQTLEKLMRGVASKCCEDKEHKGCLITNTAAELCARDPLIADWVNGAFASMEEALTTLIKRGQKDGSIPSKRKARGLARFLMACAQGMLVLSKATNNAQTLKDITDNALAALD